MLGRLQCLGDGGAWHRSDERVIGDFRNGSLQESIRCSWSVETFVQGLQVHVRLRRFRDTGYVGVCYLGLKYLKRNDE